MFFIGVFGIENKEKEIKFIDNIQCKNCNKPGGKLVKTYNYFHFFFLPLIKWKEKYYFICEGCKSIYEIPKEKGKAVEKGEDIEISYWDLKAAEAYPYYSLERIRCKDCGKELKANYEYCPYCGSKTRGD